MKKTRAKEIAKLLNNTELVQKINILLDEYGLDELTVKSLGLREDIEKRICKNGKPAKWVHFPDGFGWWCPEDGPLPIG